MSTSVSAHTPIPLPTPRILLTSLLETLFSDPEPGPGPGIAPAPQMPTSVSRPASTLNLNIQSTQQERRIPPSNSPLSNPLKAATASQRALLATLHVVFPPPMLLQALDLLDRGLVVRVCLAAEEEDDGISDREGRRGAEEVAKSAVIQEGVLNLRDSSAAVADTAAATRREANRVTQEGYPRNSKSGTNTLKDERPGSAQKKKQNNNSKTKRAAKTPSIFQVRSSQQPPKSRFRDHLASTTTTSSSSISGTGFPAGGNTYTVHLTAWNCSCAAFAFAAFPAAAAAAPWSADGLLAERDEEGDDWDSDSDMDLDWAGDESAEGDGDGHGDADLLAKEGRPTSTPTPNPNPKTNKPASSQKWQFGGLSSDGRRRGHGRGRDRDHHDAGTPPICKHLLACLLGDKWKVLGGYVKERVVGRAEMGGLEGD